MFILLTATEGRLGLRFIFQEKLTRRGIQLGIGYIVGRDSEQFHRLTVQEHPRPPRGGKGGLSTEGKTKSSRSQSCVMKISQKTTRLQRKKEEDREGRSDRSDQSRLSERSLCSLTVELLRCL